MIEIWKDIPNYEGLYTISNLGNIKNKKHLLKAHNNGRGYLNVHLYKKGISKIYYVHRLVGYAFLENPLNLPEINHKNGIRNDNRLENLEWCDKSYNLTDAWNRNQNKEKVRQRAREMQKIATKIAATLPRTKKQQIAASVKAKNINKMGKNKHIGSDNVFSKPVINIKTLEMYSCIREAAQKNNYNYSTLRSKLNGSLKNNTYLKFLKEFKP